MPVSADSSSLGDASARPESMSSTCPTSPRSTEASGGSRTATKRARSPRPWRFQVRTAYDDRCIVAHSPAAWSFATSPSTFSRLPDDTVARPFWCTSIISAVALALS